METREIILQGISIQPFNKLLLHTYILKIDFSKKEFGESLRINQFNQCLRPMPPENGDYRN
jgi:hypothetical protein